ncbi:Protein INCA1 [Tupaia chinensis]|uniref:Protein INCA1 n=1 Tax=Tupaia chinensis TaxID=246437 RepID=L9KMF1_TUPCH|nr:Protein INCA1 [Tupaia chinensis]
MRKGERDTGMPEDCRLLRNRERCSRVVSRSPPPRLPSQSIRLMPQRYGDVFWENLSQRPRLKKAQWGSSGAASEPLGVDEEGYRFSNTTVPPDLEEGHSLTPGRAQLLWSPWSPLGGQETCSSRWVGPQASYSTVATSRNPLSTPHWVEFEPEE